MASWTDMVIADVKGSFAQNEAAELLSPLCKQWSGIPLIKITTPEYPKWLYKVDRRRSVGLQDSVRNFKRWRGEYIEVLHDMLGRIFFYDAGFAVLDEIIHTNKTLWIRPYTIYGSSDVPNSETLPLSEAGKADFEALAQATSVGMPVYNGGDLVAGSGRGVGADAVIQFSPTVHTPQEQQTQGPGSAPDEVLFHELVHAARFMRGVSYPFPVNQGYTDEEEYLSVVLSNVFLSEKRQTTFRGGQRAGSPTLKQPEKFLDNPQGINMSPIVLIERFRLISPKSQ